MKLQPRNSYSNVGLKSLRPWNISQNLQSKTVVNNNERIRTTEEQPRPIKPSSAQALKSNTNRSDKENSTNHNENKPKKA